MTLQKKILILLSLAVLTLTFAACDSEGKNTDKPSITTSVSTYNSVGQYTHIEEQLSWEAINAFPIKSSDMSIDEARQLCVDFFKFSKTACWIPDETYNFVKNASGTADVITKGQIYAGFPYVGVGSGNVYRMMDYMDEDNGVIDMSNAVESDKPYDGWKTFGNQCSIGAYWGWARVINSAKYRWTQDCVQNRGFLRIGPYTYDDDLVRLGGKTNGVANPNTVKILEDNGMQTMFESYAELKLGDGMTYYTTAGHVIMASSDAYVERRENGEIDPIKSFVTITDQGQTWETGSNASGDVYEYKLGVDTKKTFMDLYSSNYIPWTFAEWLGTDPIEETKCSFSHTGDTITLAQLWESKVTANYGIADIYAIVHDSEGNEVYKHAVRSMQAGLMERKFVESLPEDTAVNYVEKWGTLEFDEGETYTVSIVVQLGTGERPTVYTGELLAE